MTTKIIQELCESDLVFTLAEYVAKGWRPRGVPFRDRRGCYCHIIARAQP